MAKNRFTDIFAEADGAFDGIYKDELSALRGLSDEQIKSVMPETADRQVYADLIKVVEQASKDNLSQAQLSDNIKALGKVAIQLAKKVQPLAMLL